MRRLSPNRSGVCAWCGEAFTMPSARGPAPIYCRPAHRQAAYRDRLRSEAGSSEPAARSVLARRVDDLERQVDQLSAVVDELRGGAATALEGRR